MRSPEPLSPRVPGFVDLERQIPRDLDQEIVFKGTQVGRPPHHYRVDYREDLTVSGRKKPIDFKTLGLRVEMNYKNMLHRLGKAIDLFSLFI